MEGRLPSVVVDCWEGAARDDGKGYPRIQFDGVRMRLHRWAWTLLVGALDPAEELHHLCENPRCFNPWHLLPASKNDHSRLHHTNPLCRKCGQPRTVPRADKPGVFRCGPCTAEQKRLVRS